MQYLLEKQGALVTERYHLGRTVWDELRNHCRREGSAAELSSLLKVMVMLGDAPANFITGLTQHHAEICKRGRQLRAQLPSHLERQRATVVAHCPLPDVLRSLVAAYGVTTPEDMWADKLCVQAPRAKRAQTKADKEDEEDGEAALSILRRSLRLRQKRA
jgi:hypothetical protein